MRLEIGRHVTQSRPQKILAATFPRHRDHFYPEILQIPDLPSHTAGVWIVQFTVNV